MTDIIERGMRSIERRAAWAQGIGYGGRRSIEREAALALKLLGRAPAILLDIGANVGEYTSAIMRRSPAVEAHLFEPSSVTAAKLRATFGDEPTVSIVEAAAASQSGSATLYANVAGSRLGSLTQRDLSHIGLSFSATETVDRVRIADYWRSMLGRRPIDLAKLDVEGHELDVLNGFGEALGHTQAVQFEMGGCNIDTRTFFRDFWKLLSPDFAIYRIAPLGAIPIRAYSEVLERFSTANFLAIRDRPASEG